MSQGPLALDDDFGWKVDDGVEKLNRPSSDIKTHSFCDEILVFNGTSMSDVLGDWCDVLSFNSSCEELDPCDQELDIFTSSDLATNWPQCAKVIRTIRGQSGDDCCWAVGTGSCAIELMMLRAAMECHGSTENMSNSDVVEGVVRCR